MNDTEMIECREPALQMQRLIAIMKRLRAPTAAPGTRSKRTIP